MASGHTRTRAAAERVTRSAELRQARAQAQRRQRLLVAGGAVAAVAVGVPAVLTLVLGGGRSTASSPETGALPPANSYGSTARPPWPAPSNPQPGAQAAGLEVAPMSQMGQMAEHFHAHLDVLVNGKSMPVPADLGIDMMGGTGAMSDLHTHDNSGVIHIEAMKDRRYTLGQLFNEWNVRLDATHLGGLTADPKNTLVTYVDGKPLSGNPAVLELRPRQEIAIVYGPPGRSSSIPTRYDFGAGE